jgi:aminoglycoside phosphotransferase (APT) family kinase protein
MSSSGLPTTPSATTIGPGRRPAPPELANWLSRCLAVEPPFAIEPLITVGQSNEMVLVHAAARRWVLRRPPRVKNAPSAHDVLREARVLRALDQTDVPHPIVVATCEDESIVGAPFYVMEHLTGLVPVAPLEPGGIAVGDRRALGPETVAALGKLGEVDWQAIGLDGYGRPEGFLERQVSRWTRQLDSYRFRELPGLDEVARWLEGNRPGHSRPGILHGDIGLRNVMFSAQAPVRLLAILDWEMATIGDPLLDLGLFVGTWTHAGEEDVLDRSITHLEGMATRLELVECYARHSPRAVEALPYYMALALFKLACILEGSLARLRNGQSDHDGHARYAELVPALVRRAHAITSGAFGLEGPR